MTLLLWLLGIAAVFAAASSLALYSYGRWARQALGAPSHALPKSDDATPLDRLIVPLMARHPGASGLAHVFDNRAAFALRLASVREAGRSLDLASYIWRDDTAGRLLARELIAAADRGVRVRLLLDDVNVQGFDPKFRALNGHPGIEVRLFNPVRNRGGALRRGLEMLLMAVRFNRRLHAKMWIADGRVALTGGRNIGNEYFGAGPTRKRPVRDADMLMAGPLAEACEALFDSYWNSDQALPMAAFWRDYEAGLDRFRLRLDENAAAPAAQALMAGTEGAAVLPEGLRWTDRAQLVADPPEKALGRDRDGWMPARLMQAAGSAERRVRLITPYLVPGREGMRALLALTEAGVRVEVLTNALSATNHTIVHGAYRRYRRPLLAAGVRLLEFAAPDRPEGRGEPPPGGLRRGEMLHSKGFTVDGRLGFVGSFNFDLRSAWLNIEMGVLFDDPDLVAELDAEFDACADPARAWALGLSKGRLFWTPGPAPGRCHKDPGARAFRRGTSWLIGHLPIHSYL